MSLGGNDVWWQVRYSENRATMTSYKSQARPSTPQDPFYDPMYDVNPMFTTVQWNHAMFYDDVPDLRVDQYPLLRRFYSQQPARHSRYVRELYDAIREASEARRTMRHMDRSYRPDFAAEIENTPENLRYGQTQFANKRMRTFRAETARITWAPKLEDVQAIAEEYRREPGRRKAINLIKLSKHWKDIGALKRELIEMWIAERNEFAERQVKDMKAGK